MICMVLSAPMLQEPRFHSSCWESQRMRCCQLSCSWIKLYGLAGQAYIRIKSVPSYLVGSPSFAGWVRRSVPPWLRLGSLEGFQRR
nr:hypothetical protein Iba_chr12aCG0130 [Ipomoea batatas]